MDSLWTVAGIGMPACRCLAGVAVIVMASRGRKP